jgi:hypothetical protein
MKDKYYHAAVSCFWYLTVKFKYFDVDVFPYIRNLFLWPLPGLSWNGPGDGLVGSCRSSVRIVRQSIGGQVSDFLFFCIIW